MTPEEQLTYAKSMFNKKKYEKAKMQFTILVLNNPGSRIVEEAQFFLAESYFNLKEYVIAVAEYEKLIRSMPESPFVDDAVYKVGMCYFKLAPKYHLDQEYTLKAITQFRQFLDEYTDSDLRPLVEERLNECRNRLAQKEYKTGELYRKMNYHRSALISFTSVIENYLDSDLVDDAMYWRGESYRKLMDWGNAVQSYQELVLQFPRSSYTEKAKQRMKEAQQAQSSQEQNKSGDSQF